MFETASSSSTVGKDRDVIDAANRSGSPTLRKVSGGEAYAFPTIEGTLAQLTSASDREQQWRALGPWVRPYEPDVAAYRTARYPRPVVVTLDGVLWRRLMHEASVQRALDLMLYFGCVPCPSSDDVDVEQWVEASSRDDATEVRFRVLVHDSTARTVTFDESLTHSASTAEDPAASAERIRELEKEVRELTKQLRILRSREITPAVAMVPGRSGDSREGSTSRLHAADSPCSSLHTSAGAPSQFGSSVVPGPHSAVSNSHGTTSGGVSGGGSGGGGVAVGAVSCSGPLGLLPPVALPPVPQIVLHGKPLVASTLGGTIVCLPVNYLDPDTAPYVVGLQAPHGLQLVPCSIVDHRFVMFVAPQHPRGSTSVTIFCSREGGLRRYTKAVWLEYKLPNDMRTVLSYHAVNQLMQEVPLPSSATLGDPSENATDLKSDAASTEGELMEDGGSDNCSVVTSATTATNTATLMGDGVPPEHLPLTREMLEMFQPFPALAPPRQLAQSGTGTGLHDLPHESVPPSDESPSSSAADEANESLLDDSMNEHVAASVVRDPSNPRPRRVLAAPASVRSSTLPDMISVSAASVVSDVAIASSHSVRGEAQQ